MSDTLKTRIITALALLAVLLVLLWSGSFVLVALGLLVFFAAAAWESFRLFGNRYPVLIAGLWTLVYLFVLSGGNAADGWLLAALCAAIWALRLAPSLALGLPPQDSLGNRLSANLYGIAILGCFTGIAALLGQSALYLLSVMAIVWVADIGAYFAGKAFGRRKLAPSISPGKSWEGAIGGWLSVLALGAACAVIPGLETTFAARVAGAWGWAAMAAILTLLAVASVVGDLFESQLKRRAGFKDSSNLLPGHGGVLDRIDALIPVVPLAVLFDSWL
ncbi:MAG: phosphatidate cytidylyltransferase [Noviherbaspirillum sp.]